MNLAKKIYEITEKFPDSERYGLSSQMRRASVSIPSNIAEGSGRNHKKEFVQFLYLARGSLLELETQIELSKMMEFLDNDEYKTIIGLLNRTHRVINGLIFALKKSRTTNNQQRTTLSKG
ncbi:MAG: four helix bundle protein [Kosmotoga sp.]|nr:MAG: four helix bundle protein [Kosmotoga sp.]